MPSRKMRTAIYFFYGLVVEIRPKSGVPHHPPELFIHLGGAIGMYTLNIVTFQIFYAHSVKVLCRAWQESKATS